MKWEEIFRGIPTAESRHPQPTDPEQTTEHEGLVPPQGSLKPPTFQLTRRRTQKPGPAEPPPPASLPEFAVAPPGVPLEADDQASEGDQGAQAAAENPSDPGVYTSRTKTTAPVTEYGDGVPAVADPTFGLLPVLTPDEVSRFCRIDRKTAYKALAKGEIPSLRVAGRYLILRDALLAALWGKKAP